MAKGGARKGAGRPKGATTLIKAIDYFNENELRDFWADLRKRAKTSDKIALYFAEQFTGKAAQMLVGDPDRPISMTFDNSFQDAVTRKTA